MGRRTKRAPVRFLVALRRLPVARPYQRVEGPVVYALWKGSDLIYIGISTRFAARIGEHVHRGLNFDRVSYLKEREVPVRTVEECLLWHLKPTENLDIPASGADHDAGWVFADLHRAAADADFVRRLVDLNCPAEASGGA